MGAAAFSVHEVRKLFFGSGSHIQARKELSTSRMRLVYIDLAGPFQEHRRACGRHKGGCLCPAQMWTQAVLDA